MGSASPLLARAQERERAGDLGGAAELLCLVSSLRGTSALAAGEAEELQFKALALLGRLPREERQARLPRETLG